MKSIFIFLFVSNILYGQIKESKYETKDEINTHLEKMDFANKPSKVIIHFDDSIPDEKIFVMIGRKIASFGIPILGSNKEFGTITTDFFKGENLWSKRIKNNITVSIYNHNATITGEYLFEMPSWVTGNAKTEKGKAQAKGAKTSVYRGAYYNIIHLFWEWRDLMSFE